MQSRSSKADKLDLEWLKEQPEWGSVVAYFKKELRDVQNRMICSGMKADQLVVLNARAGALAESLVWAAKKPKKDEAQKNEVA